MSDYQRIRVWKNGQITIVRFSNRNIIGTECIEEMNHELFALVGPDCKIVLNFADVEHLSSEAIGKFIALHSVVQENGGALRFSNISPDIKEVFQITQLDTLFDIRANEPDALASL